VVQNTTVPQQAVNSTALDLMSAAHGKEEVAHWFLTSNTDRNPQRAADYLDLAVADLLAAKDAITTGEARELRRPVSVTDTIAAVEL
jgi:hypothetical protein